MAMSGAGNKVPVILKRVLMDVAAPSLSFTSLIAMALGLEYLGHLLAWTEGQYRAIDWTVRVGEYALLITATVVFVASLAKVIRNLWTEDFGRR